MKCLCISDFNIEIMGRTLKGLKDGPPIEPVFCSYGQVVDVLLNPDLPCWKDKPDLLFIWTRPQSIVGAFNKLLHYSDATLKEILTEVDQYADQIISVIDRVDTIIVPTWTIPINERGLGIIDYKHPKGLSHALLQMNARLVERLQGYNSIYILDASHWMAEDGKNAYTSPMWYMTKSPYSLTVYLEAANDIKTIISALKGESKKLLILDLDDTLWGGIVGDDGWKNLRLGGHDPVGEAFVDFQQAIKSLSKRGIVLGIVSKNEESIALEAIKSHPEMILHIEDFAGWKINWNDKAQNIVELTRQLNLVLSSVVFIDDNPVERERIRKALPEIFVPEWPKDKMLYREALTKLRCFDTTAISKEDSKRAQMYAEERQRKELSRTISSPDEFLKSLEVRITIESLLKENLTRATQLLNKTNQMNLTTRRLSEEEFWEWACQPNHKVWTARVSDKFGDSGLVGLLSLDIEKESGTILDFVLSCRVFGRKVEDTMLSIAIQYAKELNLQEVYARYLPTPKNKPTLYFLERSGMFKQTDTIFGWNLGASYPQSRLVNILYENDSSEKI